MKLRPIRAYFREHLILFSKNLRQSMKKIITIKNNETKQNI